MRRLFSILGLLLLLVAGCATAQKAIWYFADDSEPGSNASFANGYQNTAHEKGRH